MSTARDELALVLANAQRVRNGSSKLSSAEQCSPLAFDDADAVLAAGYRKPRTVTTVGELDALPDTAVILTKGGIVFRKYDNWFSEGVTAWIRCGVGHDPLTLESFGYDAWAHFPATVLHEGQA